MNTENRDIVLIPKTRGGTSHQDKPGVYLTGYPEDTGLYFSEITEDIFKTQNCAIYRDSRPELSRSPAELERIIEQMQLLVIPVTSALLERENRARDVEVPIALRLRKPVLFWARTNLTPRQSELFNRTCAKLQMLIKEDRNPDPIPYEEKLAAFLNESLVGGRLADRVRAAFSGQIFLSYRKKDREHVRPLLETLHRYACFWDTAVWYDEFLTIGEDFSTAIQAAMEGSGLTVLLVTPSILEPGNYAKDCEYPRARDLSLPVLPVIAEEVDREALKRDFPDLPEAVLLSDGEGLVRAARRALRMPEGPLTLLREGALPEESKSPEHDYLMGLAYLNGIHVEPNPLRGIALITRAAEQGFEEAVIVLARMYHSGNGVERDVSAAIRWQERLVEKLRQACRDQSFRFSGVLLTSALDQLGRYFNELRRIPEAKAVYREILDLSEEIDSSREAVQIQTLASAMLGDLCYEEGNLKEAADYLDRCWKQCLQRIQRKDSSVPSTLYSYIGICMERLGRICENKGDLTGAEEYYLRGAEVNDMIVRTSPSENNRRNLAVSYERLGIVSLTRGRLKQAEKYFSRSIGLFQENMAEFRTPEAAECLAISLSKLGDLCRAKNDFQQAKSHYTQSVTLLDSLSGPGLTVEERLTRMRTYSLLGLSYLRLGQLSEARPPLVEALDLGRKLAEESKIREVLLELSQSCSRMGDLCRAEGNLEAAEAFYQEDLALSRQLYQQLPNMVNLHNLALTCVRLGDLFAPCQQVEAKYWYLEGLKLYRQAAEQMDVPNTWIRLAENYTSLARITGGDERAGYAMKAYEIWDRLLKSEPENRDYFVKRDIVLELL